MFIIYLRTTYDLNRRLQSLQNKIEIIVKKLETQGLKETPLWKEIQVLETSREELQEIIGKYKVE